MVDLDEHEEEVDVLLRAAAPRLRSAFSLASVPAAPRPRSTRRRGVVIAVVTAAIVIVGLVMIGTNRNDQSQGNEISRLHWMPTELPDGLPLVAMTDSATQGGSSDLKAMTNVYATDAAPLGPILMVRGSQCCVPGLEINPASGGANFLETTIDGRRAALADGSSGGRLLYIEVDGHWVELSARNIDDDALRAMAGAVVRAADGTAAIPAASLVGGLHLVVPASAPLDDLVLGGSEYSIVDYAGPTGPAIDLRVLHPSDVLDAVIGFSADFTPTKVAGTDGFIGSYTTDTPTRTETVVLMWVKDDVEFRLTGTNVAVTQLLTTAGSVKPISDDKWNQLLVQTGYAPGGAAPAGTVPAVPEAPPDTNPPFEGDVRDVEIEVSVTEPSPNEQEWSGTLPSGEAWSVHVTRVFDSMSLRTSISGEPGGFEVGRISSTQGLGCCPARVVTADPAASGMRVTTSTGVRFVVPLHDMPGTDGLRLAVIALPNGEGVPLAELIDADGNVLETLGGS